MIWLQLSRQSSGWLDCRRSLSRNRHRLFIDPALGDLYGLLGNQWGLIAFRMTAASIVTADPSTATRRRPSRRPPSPSTRWPRRPWRQRPSGDPSACQIQSTNPLVRVNNELKRSCLVAGIFLNDARSYDSVGRFYSPPMTSGSRQNHQGPDRPARAIRESRLPAEGCVSRSGANPGL